MTKIERWLWRAMEGAALRVLAFTTRKLYGKARLGSVVPLTKWRS